MEGEDAGSTRSISRASTGASHFLRQKHYIIITLGDSCRGVALLWAGSESSLLVSSGFFLFPLMNELAGQSFSPWLALAMLGWPDFVEVV